MSGINSIQTRRTPLYNLPFSYDNILSGQVGKLIPIQCDEVNAREYWQQNIDFVLRMSPLIHPAMSRLNVCFYSFFIPSRIITPRNSAESTWEKFIQSINVLSGDVPTLPSMYTSVPFEGTDYTDEIKNKLNEYFGIGSLCDYLDVLGLDWNEVLKNSTHFEIPEDFKISIMGLLCYQLVYNWWFRRDQIEPEIKFPLSLGAIDLSDLTNSDYVPHEDWENPETDFANWVDELFKLRTKNYERDYFTSALLEPQYGEDVTVGDGSVAFSNTVAPVSGALSLYSYRAPGTIATSFSGPRLLGFTSGSIDGQLLDLVNTTETGVDTDVYNVNDAHITHRVFLDAQPFTSIGASKSPLHADLSNLNAFANTFTINEFRLAMQLQAVREIINRGGTRYVEIMQNVYGSVVPDARLQQPVYLGGQKFPISIGTVVQSSQSSDNSALGTLAGKAQSAGGGNLFRSKKQFDEAGYILTVMCVAPRTGYVGGVPRKWRKTHPVDYFHPYFAHVGEQLIKKHELYFNPCGSLEEPNADFGYQERYAEYRHPVSKAHGEMRYSKDSWHLFRQFSSPPSLNTDFIKMHPDDFLRIFEYTEIENTSNEMFDIMIHLDITKKSPVPKYGTPYSFI